MLEFKVKTLQRFCPKCRRSFMVAPTPSGYRQSCLFCGVPLVDKLMEENDGKRRV